MSRPPDDAMAAMTVGESAGHRVGDQGCPACAETYPEPCRCGGLVHAAATSEQDADGNALLATVCDVCGRSEDEQAEP